MPELPEVETVRTDLKRKLLNKRIKEVEVRLPKIVRPKNFAATLTQNSFVDVTRRGKLIIFHLKFSQSLENYLQKMKTAINT